MNRWIEIRVDGSCTHGGNSDFDIADDLLATSKKEVSLWMTIDPTYPAITRIVRIMRDGTVVVEDVPEATGMNADETDFIQDRGYRRLEIPAPFWGKDRRGKIVVTPDPVQKEKVLR